MIDSERRRDPISRPPVHQNDLYVCQGKVRSDVGSSPGGDTLSVPCLVEIGWASKPLCHEYAMLRESLLQSTEPERGAIDDRSHPLQIEISVCENAIHVEDGVRQTLEFCLLTWPL